MAASPEKLAQIDEALKTMQSTGIHWTTRFDLSEGELEEEMANIRRIATEKIVEILEAE